MAMIKCYECDKDISDKASVCIGCGAPIENNDVIENVSSTVKSAFSRAKGKASSAVDNLNEFRKKTMKSQKQKDLEDIENINFSDLDSIPEESIEKKKFEAALISTIDVKFAEIMKNKPENEPFLTFIDGQVLTGNVRNIFTSAIGVVPPQIEVACELSEAILAPTAEERTNLLKSAVGVGGGAAGIGMIITAVGSALGWGAGVVASVSTFFVGTSVAGPAGWAIAGIGVTGIAAYFATTSNKYKDTERFLNVLKTASCKGVDAIWSEHKEPLCEAVNSEQ